MICWPHLFKEKGSGLSSSGDGGQGAVVYTLAQHQALVRQGRVSEGQAADTHTSWIQLHGTGVHPALTALGGNLLCKGERQEGQGGARAKHEDQLRDCCWQGSLHVRVLGKGCKLLRSIVVPGSGFLDKIVLLVAVLGDLSDHGVGVAHKAAAVLRKTGQNR